MSDRLDSLEGVRDAEVKNLETEKEKLEAETKQLGDEKAELDFDVRSREYSEAFASGEPKENYAEKHAQVMEAERELRERGMEPKAYDRFDSLSTEEMKEKITDDQNHIEKDEKRLEEIEGALDRLRDGKRGVGRDIGKPID